MNNFTQTISTARARKDLTETIKSRTGQTGFSPEEQRIVTELGRLKAEQGYCC